MNYYQFHIGDFRSGTFNMTAQERWIYRDMLDVYYDAEQPFPDNLDKICALVGARRDGDREIVAAVLLLKFTLEPDGYHHERCDREIAEYHAKAEIAKENGKKGGRPSKNNPKKPSGLFVGSDPVPDRNPKETGSKANHKPLTNNHKPVTKEKPTAPPDGDAELFLNVDSQVVADFKALRKQHKAPITATAMAEIAKQAELAGMTLEGALRVCCSRGWRGFKADWVVGSALGRRGDMAGNKFNVAGLDHSSTREAMAESMAKHGIVVPDGDISFD